MIKVYKHIRVESYLISDFDNDTTISGCKISNSIRSGGQGYGDHFKKEIWSELKGHDLKLPIKPFNFKFDPLSYKLYVKSIDNRIFTYEDCIIDLKNKSIIVDKEKIEEFLNKDNIIIRT